MPGRPDIVKPIIANIQLPAVHYSHFQSQPTTASSKERRIRKHGQCTCGAEKFQKDLSHSPAGVKPETAAHRKQKTQIIKIR
jgi:hypothetical protein